jgi:hypothetical protein
MIDWPEVVAGLLAANVSERLTDTDMVFAAWLDDTQPEGIGYLLLKGEAMMAEVENHGLDEVSLSAIRVGDHAEALELQQQARERGNGGN